MLFFNCFFDRSPMTVKWTYYLFLLVLIIACKSDAKQATTPMENNQPITSSQGQTVAQLAQQLTEQLKAKGFKIIADVDHAAGASKVRLPLRPTRTLIFGNPKGGTLLMQKEQVIGIDLPLKLLLWEAEDGKVQISYFNGTDLTERYGITEPAAVIEKVNGALAGCSGDQGERLTQEHKIISDRLINKKSDYGVDTTFERLQQIVKDKGLTIMAAVPHDKAAASVDLELRPTRLLIFGNPKVGTLLMQSDQRIGLDLPLKVLVYENEAGETYVSYFDASFLTERYGINDKVEVVQKVNGALNGITDAATIAK